MGSDIPCIFFNQAVHHENCCPCSTCYVHGLPVRYPLMLFATLYVAREKSKWIDDSDEIPICYTDGMCPDTIWPAPLFYSDAVQMWGKFCLGNL